MEVEISKEIERELEETSKVIGLKKKELVNHALELYLDNLKRLRELKKEMKAWEELGYNSLLNSEKKLWKKEESG